ncbi:hypothetical protein [Deinococcus sp. UYEF24]
MPLLLEGGYLWQAGLDLRSPSSSREWVGLCARGREDVFCKAAQRLMAPDVAVPFVLIYPGVTGDRDLTETLRVWKGRYPTAQEMDALVRANLFQAENLNIGQMHSLDGQLWQVTSSVGSQGAYQIGPMKVYPHTQPSRPDDGVVYFSSGPAEQQHFPSPR